MRQFDWVEPEKWWTQGFTLSIPGMGDQEILARADTSPPPPQMPGINFVALSKENWHIGCLGATANGEAGEAFIAVGPDGTRYWLDHLSYRIARGMTILRKRGQMMVTRVEDRFGNFLTYSYDGDRLSRIDASDGRRVTFNYVGDRPRISQVVVVAGGATRTWSYSYTTDVAGATLNRVGLPDGTAWNYALQGLAFNVQTTPAYGSCADPIFADGTKVKSGTISAPSGLNGYFEATPTTHGRSAVPRVCDATPVNSGYLLITRYYNNLALTRKDITGAMLGTQRWTYRYPVATASWQSECGAGCGTTTYSDVIDPSGNTTRYVFSNKFDATEGKPVRTEYYAGVDSGSPLKIESFTYADPAQGPWPANYGYNWGNFLNDAKAMSVAPMARQTIVQDGDTYSSEVLSFDAFARPLQTRRFNSMGATVTDERSYYDNYAIWVLGLPLQSKNLTTGEVVSSNTYNTTNATLTDRYQFGQHVMSYAFNAQGQLASFTDGNNHTTTLQNYKRGIPQLVGYADGTSQSLVVDDFGQISSITNQNGARTSYWYDGMGRITDIAYPTGNVAWAPKHFRYDYVTTAERGIGGAHWRRVVSQGNKSQLTYFDAMLRPILSGTYRDNDGAMHVSSRTDYDWQGRKTFVSYPVNGAPDMIAIGAGVLTSYDVLGRPAQSIQHSEQGNLVSTTRYLSGARKQVTDPKGNITTTSFQVFDQPSYDNVIRVDAPEGVVQVIERDIYGNPLSIAQGGITKRMYYDAYHRLCRTSEPESGSEVMDYDASNNVTWSATGLTIADGGSDGCGRASVATAARTVRGYDAMNRITSMVYPGGTDSSSFTYDALGNPATATSGLASWTFGRNELGLLTAEVLSVDGYQWALGYGYDTNGVLSTIRYPDEKIVSFAPDALGRPTQVGAYASGVAYSPDGDLASFNMGNGASYLAQKNLRNLISNFSYGTASSVLVSEDFSYDANANVSKISDLTNNGQRTKVMSYDGLNRLTSATASNLWGTESYTYDTLNNIRSLTNSAGTNTYNYDLNNLLTTVTNGGATVHSFQYDPRGNTINKNNVALTFDQANRLTAIAGHGAYLYDAAGRRVKKQSTIDNKTTYYAYNSAGQLMWEYEPAADIGTDYMYLGKKLVASARVDMAALRPSQVNVTLTLLGAPTMSSDGTTVTVNVDIANNGTARLTSSGRLPVHLSARMFNAAGVDTGIAAPRSTIPDILPGGHAAVTLKIPATSFVGKEYVLNVNLVQEGINWFDSWGTKAIQLGPYSPCAFASTYLCNTEFNFKPNEARVALTVIGSPTLSSDGQTFVASVDVANNGTAVLSTRGSKPQRLGTHFASGNQTITLNDLTRVSLPDIAPGTHVVLTVPVPTAGAFGANRLVQYEIVQEGVAWFRDFGILPISVGPYGVLTSPTSSSDGNFTVQWTAVPGATKYVLQEQISGGAWTNVQSSAATSWSTSGRANGTYVYRVQFCGSAGCSAAELTTTTTVTLTTPPSAAPTITGSGTSNTGAFTIGWSTVPGATTYALWESVNSAPGTLVQQNASGQWNTTGRGNGMYYYQVQGCNVAGCGPKSALATVTVSLVPATPSGSIQYTFKGKVDQYTAEWDAVAGATRYEVQRVETSTLVYSGPDLSFFLEGGASPYTMVYNYRLRACNDGGCSAWLTF
ncbi:YD repeat-containing protein [Luteibacter sp. Sphag1AF]|uniref:RHS repeat protein n=1 Tax=Luteibacter sp. Sphag1AF TaxID=2587031 RepID=UPI001609794F|nr:RHS repeat protein [Luteibacter sp. Sphag1AF]MBB3226913.1 YD repeat-containing protein [Luteibacter sp. Sphag1AF]